MEFLQFEKSSLWMNIAVFAISAGVVWVAGTRITHYADAIARITGIGRAAIGLVLLGGITSLPEVAVAIFSALAANPVLSVNNLIGSVVMLKAILAGCDALIGRGALTVVVYSPVLLLQAALGILMLVIVGAAITLGDVPLFGVGAWSWLLLGTFFWSVWMLSRAEKRTPWEAQNKDVAQQAHEPHAADNGGNGDNGASQASGEQSLGAASAKIAIGAAVIMIAGFFLSQTGDAIARQTGLGQSFMGAVFLALSTSLPDISTIVAALRLRQYEMAISDVFGTSLFNLVLIFLVDAISRGAPVFNAISGFSLFAALLGIALTTIYLIGLIERRNRTIARMGFDSLATLCAYFAGLFILYQLR